MIIHSLVKNSACVLLEGAPLFWAQDPRFILVCLDGCSGPLSEGSGRRWDQQYCAVHSWPDFVISLSRAKKELIKEQRSLSTNHRGLLRFAPAIPPATFLMRENCYILFRQMAARFPWLFGLVQSEAKMGVMISISGWELIWFSTVINTGMR